MKYVKKKKKRRGSWLLKVIPVLLLAAAGFAAFFLLRSDRVKETEETTYGIDVARYQGNIDWKQTAASGVDFVMIRVGHRGLKKTEITEDPNARYNLQEAQKYGVKIGVYFFSTAITEEEALEEADWVAEIIAKYPITYPVAYDCEGFRDPENRHAHLTVTERTDLALAFLKRIEKHGYEGMFYGSKNEMEGDAFWEVSRIEKKYKIWVAQYPEQPYPQTSASSYSGEHHMWQHRMDGMIPGISQNVDMNVAYFGYEGVNPPMDPEPPEEVGPNPEALMNFQSVQETVTAKEETNLRSIPSQGDDSEILFTLYNGEVVQRIAICDNGWSKLIYNGETVYALSKLLTTDLDYDGTETVPDEDGIQTEFAPVNAERVTAKDVVNLRNLPSVTHEDSEVVTQLKKGDIAIRTGINEDLGWSRVEYNGQTLYCVSSYLTSPDK